MNWEVTIMEFESAEGKRYKVTRRVPAMYVAETKVFRSQKQALAQFHQWLK